jgi:hypothetical protein
MVSMDISLVSLVNQNTALVVNLASEKPLDALTVLEQRVFGGDRTKPSVTPGALFIIFPKDIDKMGHGPSKQVKEENVDQEAWPEKWS